MLLVWFSSVCGCFKIVVVMWCIICCWWFVCVVFLICWCCSLCLMICRCVMNFCGLFLSWMVLWWCSVYILLGVRC